MTPKQIKKELDAMIDLTSKLGEHALFVGQKHWNNSDTKWIYMNVLLNMSNKLWEIKQSL